MAATIREIAKLADVAISTVSSVLNSPTHTGKCSAETARRILEAAAQLHYQPSLAARALRKGRSFMIAVLREYGGSFVADAIDGAEAVFHQADYNMVVSNIRTPEDCQARLKRLLANRIDGILMIHSCEGEYRTIVRDLAAQVPVVNFFYPSHLPDVPSVYVDESAIGTLGADYLLRNGHRDILLLGNRLRCIEAAMKQIQSADGRATHWLEPENAVARLTAEHLPCSAIFAYNDRNAAQLIGEAARFGLRVPEDLSILGVNNDVFAPLVTPALSTIGQPRGEQGGAAAQLLLDLIGGAKKRGDIVLQPELIARKSVQRLNATSKNVLP